MLQSLDGLPGFHEEDFIAAHREENRITSVRLNPFKKAELDIELNAPVKWSSGGYYLNNRPSFTHDPLFQAGCYYVQEAGSMFLEHALKNAVDIAKNLIVLDLCASPGGKSTLINSLITEESLLIANEVVRSRAGVLAMNLSKWGTCNTIVTNNEPEKFTPLSDFFDVVVVDAPCSGSGLFRKQPDAIDEWSVDAVNMCSIRQKKILQDILPALKENGVLLYSTCSYSVEENENIVKWLVTDLDMEYVPVPVMEDWGVIETEFGYRFYPHLTQSEGFFLAVLRKRGASAQGISSKKVQAYDLPKPESAIINEFVNSDSKLFYKNGAQIHMLNKEAYNFISGVGRNFYFKKAGVTVGEIKGKDLVPAQELAWSVNLRTPNRINLDKANALKYLKKETFETGEKTPGFSPMCYKNLGLGWAKILPNRINNYLPNELRILK